MCKLLWFVPFLLIAYSQLILSASCRNHQSKSSSTSSSSSAAAAANISPIKNQGLTSSNTIKEKHISHIRSRDRQVLYSSSITSSNDPPATTADGVSINGNQSINLFPCGDEMDQKIIKLALPALLNFAIFPLVGAADTFWVGRMRNALALGGQGAANQVFNSAFWILSFLPSVVTPLVAKAHGAGDKEAVKARVGEALFIASLAGLLGTLFLTIDPSRALGLVMKSDAASRTFAEPYLRVRGITFTASLLSTVGFAAFRGTFDIVTPLKISILSNLVNVIMDPILIFNRKLGVSGAALATCLSEVTAFLLYAYALISRKMINWRTVLRPPSLKAITPLLVGGFSVQLRAIAINIAMIAVTRTTQTLDTRGTSAAAHSISLQLFQLGSVASLALSVASSVIIPSIRAQSLKDNIKPQAPTKQAANRLLIWGAITGLAIGLFQILSLPLLSVFSPLVEVQEAARLPSMIGAFLQVWNCIIWTGEGIQQGNGDFLSIAASTMLGTLGMMISLYFFGSTLVGVWGSFSIIAFVRLLGVLRHHFYTGPYFDANK